MLLSTSAPVRMMTSWVSSGVETLWELAVGASLIDTTVRLIVATFESLWPSFALKVKLSGPL